MSVSLHSWAENDHCRYCGEFYMSLRRVDPCPARKQPSGTGNIINMRQRHCRIGKVTPKPPKNWGKMTLRQRVLMRKPWPRPPRGWIGPWFGNPKTATGK